MKEIELWEEGFRVTGQHGTATHLGTYKAKDVDEAIEKYLKDNPKMVDLHSYESSDGRHRFWGCKVFDNEKDARKGFG